MQKSVIHTFASQFNIFSFYCYLSRLDITPEGKMASCNIGRGTLLLCIEGSKRYGEWYTKDFYNKRPVFWHNTFNCFIYLKRLKNYKHQT